MLQTYYNLLITILQLQVFIGLYWLLSYYKYKYRYKSIKGHTRSYRTNKEYIYKRINKKEDTIKVSS